MTARDALLVVNPASRLGARQRAVSRIAEILGGGGWRIRTRATAAPGHASALAREAAEAGAGAVFVLGGDGTLREAAAGLLGSPVPLGFLPGGTAGVMALALGLPRDPFRAATALRRARPHPIDVGRCGDETFLMQVSTGLDAFVLGRLRQGLKRRLGRAAVGLTAAVVAPAYPFPRVELEVDGRRREGLFAAVCNIPLYGGGWRMISEARPDDRRLDLLLFRGRGRWATAGFVRDLFLIRRHRRRADVEVLPVRERVEILASSRAPVQIDGDALAGAPPWEIALAPERLQ
ncbi:MAG: diacylglycerol kinase family protein, partial [Thermoanaerobaculia bacterium]|nr:diacylglycerol kinase family protein [Thermoanaerobaculia bacterium]